MEPAQIITDFKFSMIMENLNDVYLNKTLLDKIMSSDEIEKNRIAFILNRIKKKGGSVKHFMRYLELVYL